LVKDDKFIECRKARVLEIPNSHNDSARRKISRPIIILPNHNDTGMMSASGQDKAMRFLKISVVFRNDNPTIANGPSEMKRIIFARNARLARIYHVVASLP